MNRALSGRQKGLLFTISVVGLLLLGWGVYLIGDRQQMWSRNFNLQVKIASAGGIETGSRVRIQGVTAGQVKAITLPATRGDYVIVTLEIAEKYRSSLGEDCRALIQSEGLLGSKVVELHPGSPGSTTVSANATIPGHVESLNDDLRKLSSQGEATLNEITTMLADVKKVATRGETLLKELEGLTGDLRQGEGRLGKEVVGTLQQVKQASSTLQDRAEAMKHLPIIGKHMDENAKLIFRPGMDKLHAAFTEEDLFVPGRSVFTPQGVERLAHWAMTTLPKSKVANSEVVIVSYTDGNDPVAAQILTQEQADAIQTYLRDHHSVHKLGTFSRRTVTSLGMGTKPAPGEVSPNTPPRRIEILIFAPVGTLS